MTYPTEITLPFADGEYRFWLPLYVLGELERDGRTAMGLETRLRQSIGLTVGGVPMFTEGNGVDGDAIRTVIRLALIGGNRAKVDGEEIEVGPRRARELVDAYVYPARPIAESAALAWRILSAAVFGNDPEPVETDEPDTPETEDA